MAVVRLKRRLTDDPLEALVLTCKKLKTDEGGPTTALFKFAATVQNPEDVSSHLKQHLASPENFKKPAVKSISEKIRNENKLASQKNRLKVVNCFRSIDTQDLLGNVESENEDGGKTLAVVDMEACKLIPDDTQDSTSSNDKGEIGASDEFVYDLYYANFPDVDDSLIDKFISGHWSDNQLLFDQYRLPEDDDSDKLEDEDDSNDEDNWRNDYPDEDELSVDEDDMRMAVKMDNFTLDGDRSDLSTEDDEEELIYTNAVNPKDIFMYGRGYANYKAKVSHLLEDSEHDTSESD